MGGAPRCPPFRTCTKNEGPILPRASPTPRTREREVLCGNERAGLLGNEYCTPVAPQRRPSLRCTAGTSAEPWWVGEEWRCIKRTQAGNAPQSSALPCRRGRGERAHPAIRELFFPPHLHRPPFRLVVSGPRQRVGRGCQSKGNGTKYPLLRNFDSNRYTQSQSASTQTQENRATLPSTLASPLTSPLAAHHARTSEEALLGYCTAFGERESQPWIRNRVAGTMADESRVGVSNPWEGLQNSQPVGARGGKRGGRGGGRGGGVGRGGLSNAQISGSGMKRASRLRHSGLRWLGPDLDIRAVRSLPLSC